MRTNPSSSCLTPVAVLAVFLVSAASAASAQTPGAAGQSLESVLVPGTAAWITEAAGREEKVRVVEWSGGVVMVRAGEEIRRIRTTGIVRARVRRSDSLINGALIGAGAAIASGLYLCNLTEPWEICGQAGPIVRIGAVGAGIGIAVDALIRGRKTVYDGPNTSTRLRLAPIVAPHAGGVQGSVSF